MSLSQMLYEMCHDILSAADVTAIRKSRGFSEAEAASRSLFEHVFLSSTGVAGALQRLSPDEVATLHLLHLHDQVVDVTFFARLYGGAHAGSRTYGTFTQHFKPIFDAVQRNLVRKGVLILGTARTNSPDKTKMELWRYRFPPDFGSFLPPLFQPSTYQGTAGTVAVDPVRAELRRLPLEEPDARQRRPAVQLGAGGLTIGSRPFSVRAAREWRQALWESNIFKAQARERDPGHGYVPPAIHQGYLLSEDDYHAPSPLPAVLYAFARLGPDQWIAPEDLDVLLDRVYAGAARPSASMICTAGWEAGCLARHQVRDAAYYRVADSGEVAAGEAPEAWLPVAEGKVFVDLERIPYAMLELLNRIADLKVADGRVQVIPSLGKMVHEWALVRDHALPRYLRVHGAAFRAMLKQIDAQWGRLIIHENLLVARITDLSLRVALRQALCADGAASPRPIFLSDEYMAFPRGKLGEIEKLVKKAGHVIKTIRAS